MNEKEKPVSEQILRIAQLFFDGEISHNQAISKIEDLMWDWNAQFDKEGD